MKSSVKGVPNDINTKYPCLKVFRSSDGDTPSDEVVLFVEPCKGFVVHSFGCGNFIGDYSSEWNEDSFELFDGTIELSN